MKKLAIIILILGISLGIFFAAQAIKIRGLKSRAAKNENVKNFMVALQKMSRKEQQIWIRIWNKKNNACMKSHMTPAQTEYAQAKQAEYAQAVEKLQIVRRSVHEKIKSDTLNLAKVEQKLHGKYPLEIKQSYAKLEQNCRNSSLPAQWDLLTANLKEKFEKIAAHIGNKKQQEGPSLGPTVISSD